LFDKDAELLQKAFQEHLLDHRNLWHWRGVLMQFAAAHYGVKPKGGRPPEWAPGEHRRFTADYNDAVR
jgi:hypothetical protein